MFHLDKAENFAAEGQSQNVFQISQKLILSTFITVLPVILVKYHFLSFLLKILEHQFSYPENRVEHSPENSKALVSFF